MPQPQNMLDYLEEVIHNRMNFPTDESYTASLLTKGLNKIAQKVGEEATEVIVASLAQGRKEQVSELADLFYHTLVLMSALDLALADVYEELEKRHRK